MRKTLHDMVATLCDTAGIPAETIHMQNATITVILEADNRITIGHLLPSDNGSEAAQAWVIRMYLNDKNIWFATASDSHWAVELIIRLLYPALSRG